MAVIGAPSAADPADQRHSAKRSWRARLGNPDWPRIAPIGLVLIAISDNLFILRTEVRSVAYPNDTGVHVSMVRWAEQRIRQGYLPFDGWYPRLSLGLSQFHVFLLKAFLSSSLPAEGLIPVVAFGGDAAAQPTAPDGDRPSGPAGPVKVQYDEPDDGVFGGEVVANRPAVAMLKASDRANEGHRLTRRRGAHRASR
jgi:hypothetical protein